jgi:hypothetical protein
MKYQRKTRMKSKANRYQQIAELYLAGHTQTEIAEKLEDSQPNICYHLTQMRREWKERYSSDFDQKMDEELAHLQELYKKAMAAYERSCEDSEWRKQRIEKGKPFIPLKSKAKPSKLLVKLKEVMEEYIQGRDGDPRFLELALSIRDQIQRLQGMIKPPSVNLQQNTVIGVDWNVSVDRPSTDPISEDLKLLEAKDVKVSDAPKTEPGTNGTGKHEQP